MFTDTEQENGSSVRLTPLIAGIVQDAQALFKQQLALLQSEARSEMGRLKDAAISVSTGMAVVQLAGFFLLLAAAHAAVWLWPEVPLFAAFGLIGTILAIVGAALLGLGKTKIDAFDAVGAKPTGGPKENVPWTKKM